MRAYWPHSRVPPALSSIQEGDIAILVADDESGSFGKYSASPKLAVSEVRTTGVPDSASTTTV